ncbi:MAG: helix-turn-helix domain-containing protein [Nitrospirales bacterium]
MMIYSERRYRVREVAECTGYAESTVRKMILRRELGYHKVGRLVLVPESEIKRILADFRPALGNAATGAKEAAR